MQKTESQKNYGTAVILSGIFGILGIHHFYLGCWLHGLVDLGMTVSALFLITNGHEGVGLLILGIDILHTILITILLLTGGYKDGEGCYVTYPGQKLN